MPLSTPNHAVPNDDVTPEDISDTTVQDGDIAGLEILSDATPDPLRVLLIEDDPDHAALVEAYLADLQDPAVRLEIAVTVEKGTMAIYEAQGAGDPFHVVLADQQLPDSAYWQTVGLVVEAARETPVVALTSLGDMDIALDAVRAGASDYLVKADLTPEVLRRTLRYAVERSLRDEALRTVNEALRQTLQHVRQMHAQVVEQEKLAGLGRLLSGVAHELRNPLGLTVNAAEAASAEAEALAAALPDLSGDAAAHLEALVGFTQLAARNGRRTDAVVRSMYDHARGVEGETRTVSLADIVRPAVAQSLGEGVDIQVDIQGDAGVTGSGSALTRMLANLVENAVIAARAGGGAVRVSATQEERPLGPEAVFVVEDDGPGLSDAVLETAFEPFVSGWDGARRIGLGLTLARAIALGHGGRIEIRPAETGGTVARVVLPIHTRGQDDASAAM